MTYKNFISSVLLSCALVFIPHLSSYAISDGGGRHDFGVPDYDMLGGSPHQMWESNSDLPSTRKCSRSLKALIVGGSIALAAGGITLLIIASDKTVPSGGGSSARE